MELSPTSVQAIGPALMPMPMPTPSLSTTSDHTPTFPTLADYRATYLSDLSRKIWDCRRAFNELSQLPLSENTVKKDLNRLHRNFQQQVEASAKHINKARLHAQELADQMGGLEFLPLHVAEEDDDSPRVEDHELLGTEVIVRPRNSWSSLMSVCSIPPQTKQDFVAYIAELAQVATQHDATLIAKLREKFGAIASELLAVRATLQTRSTDVRRQLDVLQPVFTSAKKREKKDIFIDYVKAALAAANIVTSHASAPVSALAPAHHGSGSGQDHHRLVFSHISNTVSHISSAIESPNVASFGAGDNMTDMSSADLDAHIHRLSHDSRYLDRAIQILESLGEDVGEASKGVESCNGFWEDTERFLRYVERVVEGDDAGEIDKVLVWGVEMWHGIELRLGDFVLGVKM